MLYKNRNGLIAADVCGLVECGAALLVGDIHSRSVLKQEAHGLDAIREQAAMQRRA